MVIFKNKDDNIYIISWYIGISTFHRNMAINVSLKIWDLQISKWFTSIFTYF